LFEPNSLIMAVPLFRNTGTLYVHIYAFLRVFAYIASHHPQILMNLIHQFLRLPPVFLIHHFFESLYRFLERNLRIPRFRSATTILKSFRHSAERGYFLLQNGFQIVQEEDIVLSI